MNSQSHFNNYNSVFSKMVIPSNMNGQTHPQPVAVNFTTGAELVQTDLLVIDSASRNWDTEDSNCYTIFLNDELNYVHSIELVDGYVPHSAYMVTTHNNMFYFQETHTQVYDNTYYSAEIPIGNYTITELLNQLKVSMQTASGSISQYQCVVNLSTHRITISTDNAINTNVFNLIFTDGTEVIGDRGYMDTLVINPITDQKQIVKVETSNSRHSYICNSIGKMLGFKAQNLSGSLTYTGQMIYKLRPNDYIAIFVNTENSERFDNIMAPSPDNGADKAFAIVPLKRDDEYESSFACRNQTCDNIRYLRVFNPPISFRKIKIRYQLPTGELYDFNGLDNHLTFEIKRVNDRNTITRLGDLI